jgi:hypothetical protein
MEITNPYPSTPNLLTMDRAASFQIGCNLVSSMRASLVEQPAGIELILDLGTAVAAAVAAALPANTSMGYELSADTLGALPEVHGYIDFDFITYVTMAGDPLG